MPEAVIACDFGFFRIIMQTPFRDIPQHVAFIMDGNGRWAKSQNKPRLEGHLHGVEALKRTVAYAVKQGIRYLTFYAFSTENWQRPEDEVHGLMELLSATMQRDAGMFVEHQARLQTIGDLASLPATTREQIEELCRTTAKYDKINVIMAINYGARWDIINAVNNILHAGLAKVDAQSFGKYLSTADFPDPELMIRTGGERRLSNFLLYQLAYSELYFCPTYWPDFSEADFQRAIDDYQHRERRFGKTSEQLF